MSVSGTSARIAELADGFVNAPPERLDEQFRRLTGALWDDGVLTELALPAVPALVARLDKAADDRKGHLAVLLPPGDVVQVKAQFTGYLGKYVYHCHFLEHGAIGMMGQMEIVD